MSSIKKNTIKENNVDNVWNNIRATQGECFVYQMTTMKQPCGTYDRIYPLSKAYIETLVRSGISFEEIKKNLISKADIYRILILTNKRTEFYDNPTEQLQDILDNFIKFVIGLTILKAIPPGNEFGIVICRENIGQMDKIY